MMSHSAPRYEPLVHLSTDIQIGAADALVTMGKMLAREKSPADKSYFLAEIEKRVVRMSKSIANYKRAIEAGRGEITNDEYCGIASTTSNDGEA